MSTSSSQPFRIESPCPAQWEKMKITAIGRHCLSCQKEVVDFRKMSRDEMLIHLMTSGKGRTCGKFYRHQLDEFQLEDLITPKELRKWPASKAFAVLTLAVSLLVACDNNTDGDNARLQSKDSISTTFSDSNYTSETDSIQQTEEITEDSISNCNTITGIVAVPDTNDPIVELTGEVLIPHTNIDTNEVHGHNSMEEKEPEKEEEIFQFVDQMPEFTGGTDSLFAFLKENIKYPQLMVDAGMEGKVFVSFVVQKDGKITDSKIVRSLQEEADKEALRVVNAMPDWIPGKYRGKAVPVLMYLPIVYRLVD